MPGWKFVAANSDGSLTGELTEAKGKTVTWYLDAPATASYTLNGNHPQAALITETESDLVIYSSDNPDPKANGNTVKRFRGRHGASSDDLSPTGFITQFSAIDYRGFFDRRLLLPGATESFPAWDQADIAWQLIADTQAQTDGDLGIVRGAAAVTGVVRTINYQEGSVLSQLLTQLGNLGLPDFDGFDWEIDPELNFNLFFPQRGSNGAQVLDYGGRVIGVNRTVDPSNFANVIRYSGAENDASGSPLSAVIEPGAIGAAGRWEKQIGDTTILDSTTLTAAAIVELAKDIEVDPSYQLTLAPGWWTPDILWLGDTARVVVRQGRLSVNALERVTQIAVTVGDNGGETVVMTVGPVVRDLSRRLGQALQRISRLEHR